MENRTIITSLRMENFGCFRDHTVRFGSGINQLIGCNESGKSTVVRALHTVIFEDGTTRKKTVTLQRRWSADGPFILTLEFSIGEKHFTLRRDFGTGKDVMTDSDGIVYEGKVIGEKLAKYFGTSDRTLFESLFSFSSDNPSAPEASKGKLLAALETPVFYGFDRTRADRYLEEEIKKLDNPRAHGPRELDVIGEQITVRLQDRSELEKRLAGLERDKQELDDVRLGLEENQERVVCLEKEVAGGTAYIDVNRRMVALEERLQVHLNSYSRAAQVADDVERIEKELNSIQVPSPEGMATLAKQRDELVTQVDQSKGMMDSFIVRRKRARRGLLSATLILAVLALAFILLESGVIRSSAAGEIIPFAIWVIRFIVYATQSGKRTKTAAAFRRLVARLDGFYDDINTRYALKAADPIKSLEERLRWKQALEMSRENLHSTIDVLSEHRGLPYLLDVKTQIETEVAQLNRELAPLTGFAIAASRLQDLNEELIAKRVRVTALRERAALLSERCSVMDTLQKDLTALDEETAILKRKHRDLSERLEILKITRVALNRAADQLIEDTFSAYSQTASDHMARLTDGRYAALRFSKETGRFEVKVSEADRWVTISEALSSSTRDCVYLAIRLAALTHLAPDFAPPVILDQPSGRMDADRRGRFFGIIKQLEGQRQVICAGLPEDDRVEGATYIAFAGIMTAEPEPNTA
jgi:uncharacterized protein YhaN